MPDPDHFVRVDFVRFEAFGSFSLSLRAFDVPVSPDKAGKLTILAAFRILAAAMRRGDSRKAELAHGPSGSVDAHCRPERDGGGADYRFGRAAGR